MYSSQSAINPTCSNAMKRLAREASEMHKADPYTHAQPIGDNLFEWHFTIRGQSDSDFSEGIYHGRLLFPSNYPLSPPEIFLLTPNGVFETDTKICLSMSSYHPETWMPSWSIRTGLLALIGFMPNCPEGVLGHIKRDADVRKQLALQSVDYKCSICGVANVDVLKSLDLNKADKDNGENEDIGSICQSTPEQDNLIKSHFDNNEEKNLNSACENTHIEIGALTATANDESDETLSSESNEPLSVTRQRPLTQEQRQMAIRALMDPSRNNPDVCNLWSTSNLVDSAGNALSDNQSNSSGGVSGPLSSFLTSTLVVVFIFFFMRNVYLWSTPGIDDF